MNHKKLLVRMSRGALAPELTSLTLMSGLCSCKIGVVFISFFKIVCLVRALPFSCAVISYSLLVFLDFV